VGRRETPLIRRLASPAAVLGLAAALLLAAPARPQPVAEESAPAPAEAPAEAPAMAPESAELPAGNPADDDLLLEFEDPSESDPLEPSNRVVFGANDVVYRYLFDPLADVYGFVLPGLVRRSVLRFFDNLGEPAAFLNEMLQVNPGLAGRTGARFLLNTTVGVAGLFDPASHLGLPHARTDFGETLGVYGVGHGWYLVVPVLGPSSVRDLLGSVVEGFLHPETYFLGYVPQAIIATSGGFSRYDAARDDLDTLRQSSIDFYAAMRSAYLMQRDAEVREARSASPLWRRGSAHVATAAPD
jgi:phospholipid-binding lipoprotein MlaA